MGRKSYNPRHLLKPSTIRSPASAPSPAATTTTEWLNKEEMASRLRMSKRYFEGLIKAGKVPHRKYSRKMVRFDPVMVEAALTKSFEPGAAP